MSRIAAPIPIQTRRFLMRVFMDSLRTGCVAMRQVGECSPSSTVVVSPRSERSLTKRAASAGLGQVPRIGPRPARRRPHGRVLIADGYHRLCATYSFDDALISRRIVQIPDNLDA